MFRRLTTIALAGGLSCVLAPAAYADLEAPEQLALDTYRTPNVGLAGPVSTTQPLTAGRAYVVTVQGTFSAFQPHVWAERPLCGTPEAAPMFPTAGRPTAPAGQDAEVFFARPWEQPCSTPLPRAYNGFQTNTGGDWSHPGASDGPYTEPRADHAYTYVVAGAGQPLAARQVDSQTTDNTGVLNITVRPAVPADCRPSCPGAVVPSAAGPSTSASSQSRSSSTRRCTSRRRLLIRIVTRRRDPVRSASVRFRGKQLKVTRRRIEGRVRHTATLDFRGLQKEQATASIRARLRSGRIVTGTRVYRTCDRKLRGGTPRL